MDSNGTLAFQETYYKGYAEFWWNTQTHMDMARQQASFQQFDTLLATQIFYDIDYLFPEYSV
jgi:hypothetical protein